MLSLCSCDVVVLLVVCASHAREFCGQRIGENREGDNDLYRILRWLPLLVSNDLCV